jgi:hypothetical protein
MPIAACTFVYNESVNLPIWIKYYGAAFGPENLFIIDRSSDDGSTDNLGPVNIIKIPRPEFDEDAKTHMMSSFHSALTSCYDCVVITDADEVLIPDPNKYEGLVDYIARMPGDYVNAVGVDIVHVLTQEAPLDPRNSILSQRGFGRFHAPECKQLISKVPTRWLPGLHSSNKPPKFDPDLVLFHLKLMDYAHAVRRQSVNLATKWSKASLEHNYGAHHRYSLDQFVRQSFLVPIDLVNRKQIFDFEFSQEVADLHARTIIDSQGYHRIPMDISKMVNIPQRFSNAV